MINTKYIEFMVEGKTVFAFFPEVFQHIDFAETVATAFSPMAVQVLSAGQASIPGDTIKLSGESISLGIRANREARVDPEALRIVIYNRSVIAATDADFLVKVFVQNAISPEFTKNEYGEMYIKQGKSLLFY